MEANNLLHQSVTAKAGDDTILGFILVSDKDV